MLFRSTASAAEWNAASQAGIPNTPGAGLPLDDEVVMLNHPRAGFAGTVVIGLFNGLGNPSGDPMLGGHAPTLPIRPPPHNPPPPPPAPRQVRPAPASVRAQVSRPPASTPIAPGSPERVRRVRPRPAPAYTPALQCAPPAPLPPLRLPQHRRTVHRRVG